MNGLVRAKPKDIQFNMMKSRRKSLFERLVTAYFCHSCTKNYLNDEFIQQNTLLVTK